MDNTLTIAQPRLRMGEPHDCTDAKDVLGLHSAFFDPLVTMDGDMNFIPALAQSWAVSDDARTWTFTLRPDATFHNGRTVDAEAAAYSLRRMARPDMGVTLGAPGVYHQYLAGMEIDILDRRTFRVELSEPIADLLDLLVTGYILPPDVVEQRGLQFKTAPIGSGPFEFVAHEDGLRVLARKNPRYFQRPLDWDAMAWMKVTDPDERLRMIREGKAHIAAGPPLAMSAGGGALNSIQSRATTVIILIFNAGRSALADTRVRSALNLGVDRQALIREVLKGAGYALNGFVGPAHFGFDPGSPPLAYDPDRARVLLKEAGHGDGLGLTLDSPTSLPDESVALSEALREQLGRIGVTIKIVYTEDRERYANKVRLKEIHDMCVFDSSPLSTFRVLNEKIDARFRGSWWQGYHNGDVEKILDTARSTVDNRRREALYRQCFRLLNADPPWLYLYNLMNLTCAAPSLSGWKPPAHGVIDPRHIRWDKDAAG